MWFERLTGFREEDPEKVRENLTVEGETMTSTKNGQTFRHGRLETPSLKELRERATVAQSSPTRLRLREVVANVQDLHVEQENAGALFQVASQFNLLEMSSPSAIPEDGVDIYEEDLTQGPACAVMAGAGTIYRNYFAPVNGRIGQTVDNQIDCLADLYEPLGNSDRTRWTMKNGYVMATATGLRQISEQLSSLEPEELDELRRKLRIGIQWDTQLTMYPDLHSVTQAYCSALPVSYNDQPTEAWSLFAQLILQATYEATFCAAVINSERTGNNRLFLTLVGGGVFGNDIYWICDAIYRACQLFSKSGLDVAVVSYGSSKREVQRLTARVED